MRRLVAATAAATILATSLALLAAPHSARAVELIWYYYRDRFEQRAYDGNDGTAEFSTPWIEVGEANGPTKGYASVSDHDYCYEYCLQIGGGELAVGNVGIQRWMNLEGALAARVTYIYATDMYGGESSEKVALQVSADGGATFTTLKVYQLDNDEDMNRQDYIDITNWVSGQTVLRFISIEGAPENVLLVDDFLVKAQFDGPPPPPTTTTTAAPTTTTSTTTTVPPTTTTTTTLPPTSTTTTAPPVTTTTIPGSTTTTVPPSTTTTLPSEAISLAGNGGFPPAGSAASFATKDRLVVTGVAQVEVPNARRSPVDGSEPVSLTVTFRTAAEAFTGGALPATILGVLIAVLAVIGLNRGLRADTE